MRSLCFDQEHLDYTASSAYPAISPPLSPCHPGLSVLVDDHIEGSLAEKQVHATGKESTEGGRSRVTIDMLPDVALLRIFDFYVDKAQAEAWHTLVHVCQTWRNVAFGSPRRLNLRLLCKARTPVRKILDIWPRFPIIVVMGGIGKLGINNNIEALKHKDRICRLLIFKMPRSEIVKVLAALQRPFPALTFLHIESFGGLGMAPVIPASFLGGSAPALRSIHVRSIPFPGLPKLLLSATHLKILDLWNIPFSGYISPEAIVACLSVLTRLEKLHIGFESPRSHRDLLHPPPPPPTHTHLPVLTVLRFEGAAEYLEELLSQIYIPLLHNLRITFFHQLIFHTPQLTRLINTRISHTPKFKAHCDARVEFSFWDVTVALPQIFDGVIELGIAYRPWSDWELSSVVQLCNLSFPPALIPVVEYLYIIRNFYSIELSEFQWQETHQWLRIFHSFTDVKNLYIASELTSRIAFALQELVRILGETVTEVLPALQTLFLEEPLHSVYVQEAIGRFVAARQLSSHPILVSRWERKRTDGRES